MNRPKQELIHRGSIYFEGRGTWAVRWRENGRIRCHRGIKTKERALFILGEVLSGVVPPPAPVPFRSLVGALGDLTLREISVLRWDDIDFREGVIRHGKEKKKS